jgi:hypothetical protein
MPRGARPDRQLWLPPWLRGDQAARVTSASAVPAVAILGSQARSVVMTACSWRRMVAAMTAWAWVGFNALCSRPVRCRYRLA